MQYVFLIRSRAGCKNYITWLRLVTYFLQPALECIKNTYCMGKRLFLYLYKLLRQIVRVFCRGHAFTVLQITVGACRTYDVQAVKILHAKGTHVL